MTRRLTLPAALAAVLVISFAAVAADGGSGSRDVIVLDEGGVAVLPQATQQAQGTAGQSLQARRQMLMSMSVAPSDPYAILALADWLNLSQDQENDIRDNIKDTRNDVRDTLSDAQRAYLLAVTPTEVSIAGYCRDLQAGGIVETPGGQVGTEQDIVRSDADALMAQGASEQATAWRAMLMGLHVGPYDPAVVLALAKPLRLTQDQYNDIVDRMRDSRKDAVDTLNYRQAAQLAGLGPRPMSMDTLCQDLNASGIATPTPGAGPLTEPQRRALGPGEGSAGQGY